MRLPRETSAWSCPVFLIVGAVFLPALRGEFLNGDDSVNFAANPNYRGLSWPQIRWMLAGDAHGPLHPGEWLSFGLNYTLGGMNPWGYHLGNLLLHVTNATLVCLIARCLLAAAHGDGAQRGHTTDPIVAAFAAPAWGVHPLRVESVGVDHRAARRLLRAVSSCSLSSRISRALSREASAADLAGGPVEGRPPGSAWLPTASCSIL